MSHPLEAGGRQARRESLAPTGSATSRETVRPTKPSITTATVVTFEDRDEDRIIVTEAEETEEFAAEVVQRKVLSINV